MAIFKKDSSAGSPQQQLDGKLQAFIEKYQLGGISDPETIQVLKGIQRTMSANKFADFGAAFQGNASDMAKQTYLRTLIEQNFIIIRQLDKLLNK